MTGRSGYNRLSAVVYSSGTTPVTMLDNFRPEGVRFGTIYPGGLFSSASMWLPYDITAALPVKARQRIALWNGPQMVWEGVIVELGYRAEGGEQGIAVECAGYWSELLGRRRVRKRWADTRLDDGTWEYLASFSAGPKCTIDRDARLYFTPKGVAWTAGEAAVLRYTSPIGQTVKRITANYTLAEGAQNWELRLYELVTPAVEWSVTASGSGSLDVTLVTPSRFIDLYFYAGANQTPIEGTHYGYLSSVVVYSETGSINLTEIAKDVRGALSGLSTSETLIASNTFSLVPFMAENWPTYAEVLASAASYGDASFNAWAVGVRESALASDNLPVLFAEQQPALTDYDYEIALDDPNLHGGVAFQKDLSGEALANWIIVEYRDAEGQTTYLTPDDDANLKDATSITSYGQAEYVLRINTSSATVATNLARRYLAAHKDPQFRLDGPITVQGYVRAKSGRLVPACEIRAGKRIRVSNYLNDVNGTGLTFLITRTSYDDDRETCSMETGRPDDLATRLAQQALLDDRLLY